MNKAISENKSLQNTVDTHRRLLLIEPCQSETLSYFSSVSRETLFVGRPIDKTKYPDLAEDISDLEDLRMVAANQVNNELGREYMAIIFNCLDGIDAAAFYAAFGLLKAGGVLALIAPEISQWPQYFATHRGLAFSFADTHSHCYFAEYLASKISNSQALMRPNSIKSHLRNDTPVLSKKSSVRLSEQQAQVISQSVESIVQNDTSFSFITGKRGRGKTTSLAAISHKLLQYGLQPILCCPNPAQALNFKNILKAHTKQNIESIAPDEHEKLDCDKILIIDEAASISPELLKKMYDAVSHVLMASTTDGYEGSGKGLLYRWLPKHAPQCKFYELSKPFRWRSDDALEELIEDIFGAQHTHKTNTSALGKNNALAKRLSLKAISQGELVCKHELLSQVYSLLQMSHYQCTPRDLQRLMSAQDQSLFVYADEDDCVYGLICLIHEGGKHIFNKGLSQMVAHGERRVQGHLFSQALSSALLDEQLCQQSVLRIHRIAVLPQFQGRGIGSELLLKLKEHLDEAQMKPTVNLCTSFGLNEPLMRFWQHAGFNLIKLGYRRDTSSGLISGHFLERSSPLYDRLGSQAKALLRIDLAYMKAYRSKDYNSLPSTIRSMQHCATQDSNLKHAIHELSLKKLMLFCSDALSFDMAKGAISCFIQRSIDAFTQQNKGVKRELNIAFESQDLFERLHQKHIHREMREDLKRRLRDSLGQCVKQYQAYSL